MAKTSTSFKPGEIHNPNGRPKKDWTWAGLIEASMEESDETGEPYKKIITKKLRSLAKKGDLGAIKEVFNRTEGMPKQAMDLTSGGQPIPLIVMDGQHRDETNS